MDLVLDQLQQSKDYTYQTNILRSWQRFILGQSTSLREVIWNQSMTLLIVCKRSNEVLGYIRFRLIDFWVTLVPVIIQKTFSVPAPCLNITSIWWGRDFQPIVATEFCGNRTAIAGFTGLSRVDPVGCTASEWSLGYKCNHCSKGCQISELSRLGDHFGFPVSFVKHQSSFASHVQDIDKLEQRGTLGILGVACVLSLLEGGLMLEANQVPAQCVPLDFPDARAIGMQKALLPG